MNSRFKASLLVPLFAFVTACEHQNISEGVELSTFGEANRQTMAAQVVDPDPQYEYLDPPTSGEHAAQAIERYRKGAVKRPDRVSSTATNSGK